MAGTKQTRILFFGSLVDSLGHEHLLSIPEEGWSVAELRQALCAREPVAGAALARPSVRAAVNHEIVGEDRRVYPGQEIAFLPPLSGG